MHIAKLHSRITIQQHTVKVDAIGNHITVWKEFYSCAAYANQASGKEYAMAGQTMTEETLIFEVRWCKKLMDLDSTKYRILFNGVIYNMISIDDVQFRHRILKLIATKERSSNERTCID